MRCLTAGIALLVLLTAHVASAQQPRKEKVIEGQERSALTPDMRAYLEELRRQDDPKLNARRAAQFKAEQRRLRLATQQWYGISNLRPTVSSTPFMGTYSPMWSGSGHNEYLWYPTSTVWVDQPVIYHR